MNEPENTDNAWVLIDEFQAATADDAEKIFRDHCEERPQVDCRLECVTKRIVMTSRVNER